ncbi:MAG: DUF2490 domain-containing protein [Bacteroidota bacterium]
MSARSLTLISLLCLFTFGLQAQIEDNIIWASVKLQKKLDQKTSVFFEPILRLNEDISAYENSSIDIAIKRKILKDFSLQFLARTWFVPDAGDRQFLWLDLSYAKSFKKLKVSSYLRYHWALDIEGRTDADFLRWKANLFFLTKGKLQPFIGIEPWFRLNGAGELQRVRYEPGINYKINKALLLTAKYWWEESINLEPGFKFNIYVITLTYTLP